MLVVQMPLRQLSQDPAQKIAADLDGRLAHPSGKMRRPLEDQHTQFRTLPAQQRRRGRAGQRAADDDYVVSHDRPILRRGASHHANANYSIAPARRPA